MPSHESPPRQIPVVIHAIKLGHRCPEIGCRGTLAHDDQRWWLVCTDCSKRYQESE